MFYNQFKSSVYFLYLKLGAFLLAPLFILLFPVPYFDEHFGSICIISNLTGYKCWGCGISHAIHDILNLKFLNAYNHNKLSFVVFAILVYLWIKYIYKGIKEIKLSAR